MHAMHIQLRGSADTRAAVGTCWPSGTNVVCRTTKNHRVSVPTIYCTRFCSKHFVFPEKLFSLINTSKKRSVFRFQCVVCIPWCFLDRLLGGTADKSQEIIVTAALYSIRKSNIRFPYAIYSCTVEILCSKLFFALSDDTFETTVGVKN